MENRASSTNVSLMCDECSLTGHQRSKTRAAPVVSLSLVGEPVGSSLLAWVLLSQVPTVGVAVGAGLALVGIYLTAFGQSSRAPEILATRDVE